MDTARLPRPIQLCEANPFCAEIAAWLFRLAGRAATGVPCCFPCRDELQRRATAGNLPVVVDRIQPDTCYRCARQVGQDRMYLAPVGPFCNGTCAARWAADQPKGGR